MQDGIDHVADRVRSAAALSSGYASGFDLGVRWANERASWLDLKWLAAQARQPWFKLTLEPGHSLVDFLSEEHWDCEPPMGRVRLGREPFIEGVVAGASSVHDAVLSRLLR
jgi:hypothetical protein